MVAQDRHDRLLRLVHSAMRKLTPDELDGIAKIAAASSIEKRQAEAHQSVNFLKEAAALPSDSFDYRTLVRIVVLVTGIEKERLFRTRAPDVVKARHILFWLCATYTRLSSVQIGDRTSRDHSTVLHGIARAHAARESGHIVARANPVAWAIALWDAEWPAPFAPDGGRLSRRLPARVQPCA